MTPYDLNKAWDDGVERAQSHAFQTDELGQEQLDVVAGLALHSGLKAGNLWHDSNKVTCACGE